MNIIHGGCDKINVKIANCSIVSYERMPDLSDNYEDIEE